MKKKSNKHAYSFSSDKLSFKKHKTKKDQLEELERIKILVEKYQSDLYFHMDKFIFIHAQDGRKYQIASAFNPDYCRIKKIELANQFKDSEINHYHQFDFSRIFISSNLNEQIANADRFASLADLSLPFDKKNIETLNNQLRILKSNFRQKPCIKLLVRIKALVRELHQYICFKFYQFKRAFIFPLKIFFTFLIPDIRKHIQAIIAFLNKFMNDFSGCEEEELTVWFTGNGNNILQNNFLRSCIIKKNF